MKKTKNKGWMDRLSLCLIVVMASTLWFFEDILNMHILVVGLVAMAFGLQMLKGKLRFSKCASVLLLFSVGMLISLAVNGATSRILYRAFLFTMLLLFASIGHFDTDDLNTARKLLVFAGLAAAVMILAQLVLGKSFTSIYYSILKSTSRTEAQFYANRGHFAGVFTKPHEAAGLLTMAIGALLIGKWDQAGRKNLLLPMLLFIPLLLTGKRAIIVLVVATLFILQTLAQLARKRWLNLLGIGMLALIVGYVAIWYVSSNTDNVLFARFASFFESDNFFINSTRWQLWQDAWKLWLEHPVFGVGWGRFVELSVSVFSYSKNHSVNLDYLQILCETGIVGFVLMMTPILTMFTRALHMAKFVARTKLIPQQRQLILFAVYVQIFTLMYACVEVPFYSIMFFTFYTFSCIIINTYYPGYRALVVKKRKRL